MDVDCIIDDDATQAPSPCDSAIHPGEAHKLVSPSIVRTQPMLLKTDPASDSDDEEPVSPVLVPRNGWRRPWEPLPPQQCSSSTACILVDSQDEDADK